LRGDEAPDRNLSRISNKPAGSGSVTNLLHFHVSLPASRRDAMRKTTLLSALLVLAAIPALAGPREDMMAGISRCGAISDDRTFLNCVYGAAQPLRAQLGLPPAPQEQQRLVPGAMAAPAPRVATAPQAARPVPAPYSQRAIQDRLETFTFDSRGLFIIMLGNGEHWRQDPADTVRAKWVGRASDYIVRVAKDSPRSAQMSVMGDPNIYRMVRVN
jgi:hypothetical protein